MSIILSHPTGNAFVRSLANGLAENGMLKEFQTTVGILDGTIWDSISKIPPFKELQRRKYDSTLKPYLRLSPWIELARQISPKVGFHKLVKHENGRFSVDAVYKNLDRNVAIHLKSISDKKLTGVYAYEDGALQTFLTAKEKGITCFYDLPIGYWRASKRLLEGEKNRRPEYVNTMVGLSDSDEKLIQKDKEIQLADKIFVASQFTANTLLDFPGKLAPIKVIPYGFPPINSPKKYRTIQQGSKLKILFVGGLSQRKGIADLFEVVAGLHSHVELTVVGKKPTNSCHALNNELLNHRWIHSLPHKDILELMRESDLLVFPSLFEGFGLVITEAMSQGTPVITTERTAGPDLISDGHSGWIVNAGQPNHLSETLRNILMDPKIISSVGKEAIHVASIRPWNVYAKEMVTALRN
jgi:glycosyltransferase involved in cell wall biosynthesis